MKDLQVEEPLIKNLRQRWSLLSAHFRLPFKQTRSIFTDVLQQYSEVDRFYHNLNHLVHVLEAVEELAPFAHSLVTVEIAAWFHDVVYNPRAKDNEEKSAEYAARQLLKMNVPSEQIEAVKQLILKTKTHEFSPDDEDSQVLCDADLGILSTPQPIYENYSRSIRQEYYMIPPKEYTQARQKLLKKFLARPVIYQTDYFHETREKKARINLQWELEL